MQRRLSQRARTDFRVLTRDGSVISDCRGLDVSTTGILIDRRHAIIDRDHRIFLDLEIRLPERHAPLRALARPVWSFGTQQAFKFVRISDVDRLNLAEHIDLVRVRGRAPN